MKNARVEGTYFQPQTCRILAVAPESTAPGEPWMKFSDDYGLGLLAARRELENSGLVNDASGVQWHSMSEFDPLQRRRTSDLIRAFTDDSNRLRREAEDRQGFRQRLASIFTSPLRHRGEEA